jgi:RNA polymerase sigma factor (sigma-70 family)
LAAGPDKQDVNVSSDFELLIRSRADPSAFGAIYDRHARSVYSYLARRVSPQTAEDLFSEVFLRALEARRRARPHSSGSALPWLYGIARNVLRQQPRARPRSELPEMSDQFEWSTVDARLDAGSLSPELSRVLNGLSDSEREVLLLVSWEQLTVAEAAEALGISAGSARMRLHRARAHAAAALAAVQEPYQTQEK